MTTSTAANDLKQVAFHEAGHAVVGHLCGEAFKQITVSRTKGPSQPNWSEWTGEVEGFFEDKSVETTRSIAAAGPLAEAKHLALLKKDEVQFAGDGLNDLLKEYEVWERENINVTIGFTGGQQIALDIYDGDLYCFKCATQEEIRNAVTSALERLDVVEHWKLVDLVANNLLAAQPTPRREGKKSIEQIRLSYADFEKIASSQR